MVIYHNIHFVAVARSKVLVGGDNQISQRLSFLRCYARRSALLGLRPVDGDVVFYQYGGLAAACAWERSSRGGAAGGSTRSTWSISACCCRRSKTAGRAIIFNAGR